MLFSAFLVPVPALMATALADSIQAISAGIATIVGVIMVFVGNKRILQTGMPVGTNKGDDADGTTVDYQRLYERECERVRALRNATRGRIKALVERNAELDKELMAVRGELREEKARVARFLDGRTNNRGDDAKP